MGINAFYDLMPEWFIIAGVVIATTAAIIASQAMISGPLHLISEAMRLNLWPKMKIRYPSEEKGQLFIPGINVLMFVGVRALYYISGNQQIWKRLMALPLSLLCSRLPFYLPTTWYSTGYKPYKIYLFLSVYLIVELAFLVALMEKFPHGGYITLMIGGFMFLSCTCGTGHEKLKTGTWNLYDWNIIFPRYRN